MTNFLTPPLYIRGLTKLKYQLGIISPNEYFKSQIKDIITQLGIGDLLSDSALPDSDIPNPQLSVWSPTGDFISPIGDNMSDWGYLLQVVYIQNG